MNEDRRNPAGGADNDTPEESDDTVFVRKGSEGQSASPAPSSASGGATTFGEGDLLSYTYKIEKLLARGGMGEVYRASHVELGTKHAIKIILPDLVKNQKVVDLFRREASILRGARSDAIVGYDGVFRDEHGRVYLVMEYVDGPSLSQVLRDGPLTVNEVRVLRERLASGLAAAHEKGVIHRDISPDNIILAGGRIKDLKIIDFGIARQENPANVTILGDDFAGKFSYASPEQLGMFGGRVDARSDIYSVGLVLAAAARGRPLDLGNSPINVVEKRKTVPDLSGVPAELVDDITPLLQPDPKDRPQSMTEVLERGGEPKPAERAGRRTTAGAAESGSGGSRTILVAVAAVGLLAAVAGGGWVVLNQGSEQAPELTDATTSTETDASASNGGDPAEETQPDGQETSNVPDTGTNDTGTSDAGTSTTDTSSDPSSSSAGTSDQQAALPRLPDPDRVDSLVRNVTCGRVGANLSEGSVRLVGHVPSEQALTSLIGRLNGVEGVSSVGSAGVSMLPRPHCATLEDLAAANVRYAFAGGAGMLGRPADVPSLEFHEGELLELQLTTPDQATFLYVDYFDQGGNVIHLLPSPVKEDNFFAPDTSVRIGGIDRYRISPPFGLDLVVSLSTTQPLFPQQREEVESADAYREDLLAALRKLRTSDASFRAEYEYMIVRTEPAQ